MFLQPGTYDDKVMSVLEGEVGWWKGRWVGEGDEGRRGKGRGWCVLLDGEDGIEWAKQEQGKGKL